MHIGHDLSGANERPGDVDIDGVIPLIHGYFPKWADRQILEHGRIVDQDVDLPEGGEGSLHQAVEFLPVGDVAGMGCRLAAHRPHLGRDLVAGFQLAAGDEDVGTVLGEGLHHLVAQPAAAAGNEGNLAREVEVVGHDERPGQKRIMTGA